MQETHTRTQVASSGGGRGTRVPGGFHNETEDDAMQLLDRIETQLIANRLPLVAITVAAVSA